jgi:hypothetical protein
LLGDHYHRNYPVQYFDVRITKKVKFVFNQNQSLALQRILTIMSR